MASAFAIVVPMKNSSCLKTASKHMGLLAKTALCGAGVRVLAIACGGASGYKVAGGRDAITR
jgi:hypothetical protein